MGKLFHTVFVASLSVCTVHLHVYSTAPIHASLGYVTNLLEVEPV